jgi:hypothetical protein
VFEYFILSNRHYFELDKIRVGWYKKVRRTQLPVTYVNSSSEAQGRHRDIESDTIYDKELAWFTDKEELNLRIEAS